MITRRGFLGGLLAVPAIIRVAPLMSVKVLPVEGDLIYWSALNDPMSWDPVSSEANRLALALWSRKLRAEVQRATVIGQFLHG